MSFRVKLAGRSLLDFLKPPKGPTMVDFLQAQEEAREARLAAFEASFRERFSNAGVTQVSREVLPNGVIKLHLKARGL